MEKHAKVVAKNLIATGELLTVDIQIATKPRPPERYVFSILALPSPLLVNIRILIRAVRSVIVASGSLVLFCTGWASAEPYRSAESRFQNVQVGALDDFDRQWIEQRGYKLRDPKAVTVFSMKLRANNSICESGLEVQYFEDSECKGKFCRMVIKCGPSTDARRPGLALTARKDVAISSWNFEPEIFDVCVRQAILASTPTGPVLVIIARYGFEIGDPNSPPPRCRDRSVF